jgi:hypothetical protein
MESGRRRWLALALTAEMAVVLAVVAWCLSRAVDDDGAVWVCASFVGIWFALFMGCTAIRPAAARGLGLFSLIPLGLAPIVLAYVTSR